VVLLSQDVALIPAGSIYSHLVGRLWLGKSRVYTERLNPRYKDIALRPSALHLRCTSFATWPARALSSVLSCHICARSPGRVSRSGAVWGIPRGGIPTLFKLDLYLLISGEHQKGVVLVRVRRGCCRVQSERPERTHSKGGPRCGLWSVEGNSPAMDASPRAHARGSERALAGI